MARKPTHAEWDREVNLLEAELSKRESPPIDKTWEVLKVIAEQSQDMVYYYEVASKRFSMLNKKAEDFHGLGSAARDIGSTIHPDDLQAVRKAHEDSLKPGCTGGEVRYRCRDSKKTWHWLHDKWTMIRDTADKPIAIVGIVRDETGRREGEKALREKENFLNLITDNMRDMVSILDPDTKFKYVSPSHRQRLGYEPEDMLGKKSVDFIHPEDIPDFLKAVENALKRRLPEKLIYRFRHADGHYLWLEITGNLIFDEQGEMAGGVFNSRDITERKRNEDALRESEDRFRSLFDRSLDCVCIHDSKGKFLDANQAALKLLGYSREDIPSLNLTHLVDQDQLSEAMKELNEVAQSGSHRKLSEYRLRCKDGRYATVETNASVVYRNGKPHSIMEIFRDITERRRMEESLLASERNFQKLSITDSLTGLYNMRHFYDQLKSEIDRANRYGDPLTILLLDVDNFKRYNDSFGHLEGDKVLSGLAKVVRQVLRETDTAYRYGGEEFIVILPHTLGKAGKVTAERIRSEVKEVLFSLDCGGSGQHVTVSIGVAEYARGEGIDDFVKRADRNMYRAKEEGKDRVIFVH